MPEVTVPDGISAQDGQRLTATVLAAIDRAVRDAVPGETGPPSAGARPAAQEQVARPGPLPGHGRYAIPSYGAGGRKVGLPVVTPVGAEDAILAILDAPVNELDSGAQQRRIEQLTAIIRELPYWEAETLLARLERPAPSDRLARTFHYRLSTAARRTLISQLRAQVATKAVPASAIPYSYYPDPRDDPRYVDNVIEAVQSGLLMANRYTLVWTGGRKTVFNADIDFTRRTRTLPVLHVYDIEAAARSAVVEQQGLAHTAAYDSAVAYYRGAGGVILPTWFSAETTPKTFALIRSVHAKMTDKAADAEQTFRELRNSMIVAAIVGAAIRVTIRGLPGGGGRGGGGDPTRPIPRPPTVAPEEPPAQPGEPEPSSTEDAAAVRARELARAGERGRALARAARDSGQEVVVNIGGAGESHEPAHAINVNNQSLGRKGIPNLVEADGSDIGELFDDGSVDRVEGYRMAPGVIDWGRAAPGSFDVLRSGGRFEYEWRWPTDDAQVCASALRDAHFTDVTVQHGVVVTAVKP